MTRPSDGLALRLHHAARLLARRLEDHLRDRSLSSAQWRLLVLLKHGGAQRQARLAEGLDIEPISVSRMIDRMEVSGWVRRLPDPDDRRARQVSLTDRARSELAQAAPVAERVYDEALQGFSPAEVTALQQMLGRLTDNLSTTAAGTARRPAEAMHPPGME